MSDIEIREWRGHQVSLRRHTSDDIVYQQVLVDEFYKPVLGRDFKSIIDGGANIGLSTLWFAHHFLDAKIVAFEPDEESFAVLVDNAWCHCRFRFGLWSHPCLGRIANPDAPSFARQAVEIPLGSIPMVSMEMAFEYSADRPRLVKLDIEGAEVEVLRDPSWLREVDMLAIELHRREAEEALTTALRLPSVAERHPYRWTEGEITFVEFQRP